MVLSQFSNEFLPGMFTAVDKASLVLFGIIAGLSAGIFEEIGWTGFATPELRKRQGMLATGLIVGFLWGAWHYLVAFWGGGDDSGAFVLPLFLAQMLFYVAVLPAFRILMVWVYDHTQSLLVAMLMHASLTGSVLFFFMPEGIPDPALITWYLAMAAVFWTAAAVIVMASRWQLARSSVV
jgi:membrane protease YdiL (CAAX protease family)